jgi:hypothetical protein
MGMNSARNDSAGSFNQGDSLVVSTAGGSAANHTCAGATERHSRHRTGVLAVRSSRGARYKPLAWPHFGHLTSDEGVSIMNDTSKQSSGIGLNHATCSCMKHVVAAAPAPLIEVDEAERSPRRLEKSCSVVPSVAE